VTETAAERPRAYTYGPMPYTEDWYAMRRDKTNPRFGASQAAALLGISQYSTKRHVYESYFTDEEDEPNESMITGTVMEPAIQELYVRFKGAGLVRGIPTLLHKTEPLLATLDSRKVGGSGHCNFLYGWGEFCEAFNGDRNLSEPVEIKYSMSPSISRQLGDEDTDWVPNEWFCQCQQQIDVAECEEAEIACFIFGKLKIYRVHRSQKVIDSIRQAAREMRDRILSCDPPEADFDHARTREMVKHMERGLEGEVIDATDELASIWETRREIMAQIKELTNEKDKLATKFELAMVEKNACAVVLPNGKKQVVRRRASRKEHVVPATSFIELREMNVK